MSRNTRSVCSVQLGSVRYVDLDSLSCDVFTGIPARQAPTGVAVISRVKRLLKQHSEVGQRITRENAFNIVAEELSQFWIFGLNVYPCSIHGIVNRIRLSFEGRKKSAHAKAIPGYCSLLKYPQNKRNETWQKTVEDFNDKHLTGFDIRTQDKDRLEQLEKQYEVKMKDEDCRLFEDNCKLKTCKCDWDTPVKCTDCPRQMFTTDIVDEAWRKWLDRKKQDVAGLVNQQQAAEADKDSRRAIDVDVALKIVDHHFQPEPEKDTDIDDSDVSFPVPAQMDPRMIPSKSLRSKSSSTSSSKSAEETSSKFPKIPLRSGRRKLNPQIMRAFVHCQATYKVSDNDIEGICVDFANLVFDQEWKKSTEPDFEDIGSESEEEEDDVGKDAGRSELDTSAPPKKKRRRVQRDLTHRFPSRPTRRKWLKHGSLLNLRYVAKKIRDKRENQILTIGFDDTTKAAGRQLYDVKSTHITLDGEDMDRETYTTGFAPNLSHSGQDQATTLRHSLQVLSVLAGDGPEDQYSVEDLIETFDFWMSDRSADGNVLFDNLGVEDEKRLKCCGHTTLTIDEAIGSVLLEAEGVVGRDKLIGKEVGGFAYQSKNSIVILGLIAMSKGLSSSHAALSYSLYMTYKKWRRQND